MDDATRQILRANLGGHEGTKLKVYDDKTGKVIGPGTLVIGNPTIGTGRNLASRGITLIENDFLLSNDETAAEADLLPLLPWLPKLSAKRQAAVYELYFNVAIGNPKKFLAKWPTFLGQMEQGAFTDAANNLRSSQPWAHEVGPRAEAMAEAVEYG